MIHGKKALLAWMLGILLILGGCAGNQGTFTGRVEQISDWSLVAREPEEGNMAEKTGKENMADKKRKKPRRKKRNKSSFLLKRVCDMIKPRENTGNQRRKI